MLTLLAIGIAVGTTLIAGILLRALYGTASGYRESLSTLARGNLADLFIFIDPRRLLLLTIGALLVLPSLIFVLSGNPLVAVAAAVLVVIGPQSAYRYLRARHQKNLARQMPDGIAALAGAIRAGMSLPQALASLAEQQPPPLSREFELLLRKQRLGMPLDQALTEFEQRVPGSDVALFVTAVRIAREMGGNLSESLERLAETLRRKLAMEDKIRALTSQGKIQGWIVGLLPLFLGAVLFMMEPESMQPLFTTRLGWLVVGVIVILEFLGFFMIRKIVRIEV
jgi:tight adherence protein B